MGIGQRELQVEVGVRAVADAHRLGEELEGTCPKGRLIVSAEDLGRLRRPDLLIGLAQPVRPHRRPKRCQQVAVHVQVVTGGVLDEAVDRRFVHQRDERRQCRVGQCRSRAAFHHACLPDRCCQRRLAARSESGTSGVVLRDSDL